MCFKVKRVLWNEIPKNEEEILELMNLLEMLSEHIEKGVKFRIIVEELEELKTHTPPPPRTG